MTWTKAERYRSLRDVSALDMETLRTKTAASPWRFGYHIQPPTGLLNDPNGFTYFNWSLNRVPSTDSATFT